MPIAANLNRERLRFPVQNVLRASGEARRYAGQLASGVVSVGTEVTVLPSRQIARVGSIRIGSQEMESAAPPLSITVALDGDLDISRGDMLADPAFPPSVDRRFRATLLWMSEHPLEVGRPYLIKHTTRQVCGSIVRLNGVLDPTTLIRRPAETLALNEFGECEIDAISRCTSMRTPKTG